MIIRDFTENDREAVLNMIEKFYNSPAVAAPVPVENFSNIYEEMCNGGSNRVRGILAEIDHTPAGFASLSFGYSTEAGGPVVIIEEIYIDPAFRGKGIGSEIFQFIRNEYRNKAARLRLEVAKDNTRASELYNRIGFEELPYIQMIQEDF